MAQAFSSFDTYLAPFVKADKLDYKAVKQCIQSFVYGVNTPSRWGTQAPFSNITLDWVVPADMKNLNVVVGGKELDFTYGDCQKEMDMVNKAFLEIMIDGDANGRGFQYPIPTYSITKNFNWEETENNRLLFEMTAKYGTPYFSNYVNSDMEPSDVRSMAILGTQNLIYKDKYGRISKNEVRHLVHQWLNNEETEYSVLMNGKFVPVIDMFEVPYEKYDTYVSVNTANGQSQSFSYDHKCLVVRDGKIQDVLAQNILSNDKALLARRPYDESGIGTYEAGKVIGYYLAEGWAEHNESDIVFAINNGREDICTSIQSFFEKNFASRVVVENFGEKHIFKVKVFGKGAVNFVRQFISGSKATEKRITTVTYDTSADFRRGMYDGYLETDGSEREKVFAHTTNKQLCFDMISLFATIGKYFKYSEDNHNTRYFKPDKSDLVHFTSYKLAILKPEIYNDDYYTVDITGIELKDAKRINTVYNFTVDTKEHIYELPNGMITHQCCRLRLDLRELRKKSGGFFGSGESTGSVGVVTINMPRIAYLAKNEEDFFNRLNNMMDIAARSLKVKRTVITQMLENGLYPYTKRYLGSFSNHFSTIGLIGMNEVGLNAKWLEKDLAHIETQEFTKQTLNHMRERLSDYQEKYGDLYNLEATPAESTTYRLAKKDKELYPEIITAAGDCGTPYYTNSSHLPVGYTEDIFSALDIQDELQTLYTSGTVFHAFLGEKLPDWKAAATLVRKIAENYKLPYYTLSPTYSVCKDHGYIVGEEYKCPKCGKETEVYSRITGYYRPVKNWNDGKVQEFKNRKTYKIADEGNNTGCTSCVVDTAPAQIEMPAEQFVCETCSIDSAAEDTQTSVQADEAILVATPTCPNCKIVCSILDKQGYRYTKIYATEPENKELVEKLGVKTAPTLFVPDKNGYLKFTGVSEIKGYIYNM